MAGVVTKSEPVSPQEWVDRVQGAGFLIEVGQLTEGRKLDRITISMEYKENDDEGYMEQWELYSEMSTLLLHPVPRLRNHVAYGVSGRGSQNGGEWSIDRVKPRFFDEVARLAPVGNGRVEEARVLNLRFDERVAEEIGEDTELLGLEAQVVGAHRRVSELELAVIRRRAALLVERETRRSAFLYVASEREL